MKFVVTGAASGLGKEITKALCDLGHTVFGYDRKFNAGYQVANPHEGFIRSLGDNEIDGLINCAGINRNEWFEDVTSMGFWTVMDTNAWGIIAMTQALLPKLKRSKGCILNIVSNASHIPMTSSLAYNASKAAALMITKQMAHELTPKYGITVFSVSPNKLEGTEMSKQIEANVVKVRGWTEAYAREYQRKGLMHGRETDPENLGQFIANLFENGHWTFLSGTDIPFGK